MACGACCANTDRNRGIEWFEYVEIERRDRLRREPDLLRRLTVVNDAGEIHMKLTADGRCVALEGEIGDRVTCGIYDLRPAGCKRVEPGSYACKRARRERLGINPRAA